jgi:hypothetical protein
MEASVLWFLGSGYDTGELASSLHCLMLGIGLLNVGSRSLPLPKSVSSLGGSLVFDRDVRVHGGTVIMV